MKASQLINTGLVIVIGLFIYQTFFTEHKTSVSLSFSDTTHIITEFKIGISPIILRNVPARLDSVRHPLVGGGSVVVARASKDTVLVSMQDSVTYHDTVSVQYMFPPVNTFSLYIGLEPRQVKLDTVIIKDKTIDIEVPTKVSWPIVGLATIIGILVGAQL